jgi:signal transduction histidine kinase
MSQPEDVEVGVAPESWAPEDADRLRALEEELLRVGQDLHRANRELASLRDRLCHEREQRNELLTVVSHELRTPVTIISGYARMLMREEVGSLNEEQRRFVSESLKACQRLDAFIERLMQASSERRGGEVLEVQTAPLAPAVAAVVEQMQPVVSERGAKLELRPSADECRARFDPTRLEQILLNLLDNALVHAGPDAHVEIELCELVRDGRRLVEVAVVDDGPGVPECQRERIFDPYVQLGGSGPAGGLGLGLAICRRLVEAHGGRLSVSGPAGGGSRFAFTLPGVER